MHERGATIFELSFSFPAYVAFSHSAHSFIVYFFFLLGVPGRTFVRIAGAVVCLSGLGLLLFLVLHFSFLYWLLLCNVYEYELWKLQSHNDKDNDQQTRA